jgi:hypothetical protein
MKLEVRNCISYRYGINRLRFGKYSWVIDFGKKRLLIRRT